MSRVVVIVGPTAVGKTTLAIELAKKINGEIISADSMQAYKGMEILSQAPTKTQRKNISHHLVGFLSPREEYSAAAFVSKARKLIKEIIKKGKTPIIAGGSGLYIKALVDGIFPSKGKDENLRKRLYALADKKGGSFLHNILKEKDPSAAKAIHPNDLKKVVRALEICEVENKTKTSLKAVTEGINGEYDLRVFGLTKDRKRLYAEINERVDQMFAKGLASEVKRLLRSKPGLTARQALGMKQVEGFLKKDYNIDAAKELLKRDTRRFAKRQFTWFRSDKNIKWLDLDKLSPVEAKEIIASSIYGKRKRP